ncbi:MAG: hypothetical protein NTY86_03520 [Deltaproteobacteria bacterium]|nr:hypothetical protein [Deltaproteobacteria bacterium]
MVDFSSVSIPKPKNWQDFERCCRDLFECILGDPNTTLNGRPGQRQNGVDIYGRRGGVGIHYVGIQCKGKDSNYGAKVTEKELREEVKKSRNFIPPLSEFILVTTAPDDVKIQEVARQITFENYTSGSLLEVQVWGWGNLESRISRYPQAIRAFAPDASPFMDNIYKDISAVKADTEVIRDNTAQLLELGHRIHSATQTIDTSTKASETIDQYFHADIDTYRDMISDGHPRMALHLLEQLKIRCWVSASPRVRFRITTNIGAAKLMLRDERGAATDFLDAVKYDPKDRIGMANVALAHLIEGRINEAITAAQAALHENPKNKHAASYLIQAHYSDQLIADPLILISKELWDTDSVRMGVISFFRRRQDPGWRRAAQDAFSLFPNVDELKRAAAEAYLDEVLQARWFLLGERTTVENGLDKIRTAAVLLESIWEKLKKCDIVFIDTNLPNNLAIAYRAIGDLESAARVLDEALEKAPEAIDLIRVRTAVYLALDEDNEKILKFLQNKSKKDPETAVMAAELLLKNNPEAAREVLDSAEMNSPSEDDRITISLLRIESLLRENLQDKALEQARALVELFPKNIETLVALSHFQNLCGDVSANKTLSKAIELLGNASSFHDRFQIAKELDRQARYDNVVETLAAFVDYTRDTPALRLLLPAMINSDRRHQVHEAVKNLLPEVAEKPFYLRIQSVVQMNRGDYAAAANIIEQYLKIIPNDLSMSLRWIDARIRCGEEEDICLFLGGNVEKLEGNPVDQMLLAIWLDHFGFEERALRLGYVTFLNNRNQPQVHLRYMALLLFPNQPEKIDFELTKIAANSVFTVKNDRGETLTFLIEPEMSLHHLVENAITPDHPFAKKSIGLEIGDSFVLDETKVPCEEWHIISIKHKWLDALHKSMERFEHQFPLTGGLERVVIDKGSEDPLRPFLDRVKNRYNAINAAYKQYEKQPLPLELLTNSLGGDVIQVWHSLIGEGRIFRICRGNQMEREAAIDAIELNQHRGCVVDTLTFHIIRRLEIEDIVASICGPIGITETSIDVLRRRREEIRSHLGKSLMTVFWRDGQYFREEITADHLQRSLNAFEEDLSWIDEHCEKLPAEGTQDLPAEMRKLSRKIGRAFFDTILAADGTSRLLLCEDYAYRTIGAGIPGLRSSWLQPVLMSACDKKLITTERYSDAVLRMIEHGSHFISIDARVLLCLAKDKNDSDGKRFDNVAEALGGPTADLPSHVKVAANFFNKIWNNYDTLLRHKAQTGKILECLLRGRDEEIPIIIDNIQLLVPSGGIPFNHYLRRWLQGHFILPIKNC